MLKLELGLLLIERPESAVSGLAATISDIWAAQFCTCDPSELAGTLTRRIPGLIVIDLPPSERESVLSRIRRAPDGDLAHIAVIGPHNEGLASLAAGADECWPTPLDSETIRYRLQAARQIAQLKVDCRRLQLELREYSEELSSAHLRLRQVAMTDELTGLPNRRHALEQMRAEWLAAQRSGKSLSCMAIDLIGLKEINDEQGHERGDVVLKTVAAIMRKYLPPQDTVARTGGDEFLIICPGASQEAVMARARKLVTLVQSFNIHAENYSLGLSIGVGRKRAGIASPHELVNLAEQAMHHAKHLGKNRVCASRPRSPQNGNLVRISETTSGERARARATPHGGQSPLWRQSEPQETSACG